MRCMARIALGKRLTTKKGGIVLVDGLPKYAEDYQAFILERLPDYEPCSVPNFLRAIGFDPRPNDAPSRLYGRFVDAFYKARDAGKVSIHSGKWRVAVRQARAS
jgi:hypothetical protein